MEICFAAVVFGMLVAAVFTAWLSNRTGQPRKSFSSYSSYDPDELLPNGNRRSDYYAFGWSDAEIECWGLDTPAAPDPWIAGIVVWDMLDGELDGEFDVDFDSW
jgi:hypothetical protein